jgi:3-hydroxybutyrate dehydrogenase
MEKTLKGRVALVTGSTSGIGLGLAVGLAESGASVMLNGFGNPADIDRMMADLANRTGARLAFSPADMRQPDEIAKMVRQTETEFGRLDILVNNAGIQHVSPVEDFPGDKWEQILGINLSSCFYTIKAAMPGMRSRGWGRIINIASAHGLVASPFKSAYVAAKHGVVGLTKCVALEVVETAITCNAICPGYVRTPLVEGQIADQAKAHGKPESEVIRDVILAAQPNKRFVSIEELVGTLLYLCSSAADSVTGSALRIDGGWTAR